MKHIDEKIIPLKMEQKEQIPMSLNEGYYINGKLIKFENTDLMDHKLSVLLPEEFVDMPAQIKELKYPSSFRPQIIKTSLDCKVNFSFSILDNPENLSGRQTANSFQTVLSNTNPSIRFYEFKSEKTGNNLEMTYFDFTSFGVDEQMYHLICLTSFRDKIIHGVFNCPERDKNNWNSAAKEVFLSIELNKKVF